MEQTSATMLEAITVTSLSRRIWALVCSAMISRRRRRRTRGPPPVGINQSRLNRNDYVSGRIQLIGGMKRPDRQLDIFLGDQHADLDLGGRDHLDIDPLVRQGAEHHLGDA